MSARGCLRTDPGACGWVLFKPMAVSSCSIITQTDVISTDIFSQSPVLHPPLSTEHRGIPN